MDLKWDSPTFRLETHEIVTEDGYILSLLRLLEKSPPPAKDTQKIESLQSGKPPVLLVHGFLLSAAQWFINETPQTCLPHVLGEEGYDCWHLNLRGTKHAKKHSSLKTKSKKFWDFGAHEMGCFDLPASINYILETTGHSRLFYIGHSMGCTVFFMMAASKPEFCSKVKAMISLAPFAYGKHTNNFVSSSAAALGPLGKTRVFLRSEIFSRPIFDLTRLICPPCFNRDRFSVKLHFRLNSICGCCYADEFSKEKSKQIAKVFPSSTSGRTLCHGMQVVRANRFQHYDFGRSKNEKLYGQPIPPLYDFSKIDVPIALFHSVGDRLVTVKDGERLASEIPHLIGDHKISEPKFSHLSFITRSQAVQLVYEPILHIFSGFLKNSNQTAFDFNYQSTALSFHFNSNPFGI